MNDCRPIVMMHVVNHHYTSALRFTRSNNNGAVDPGFLHWRGTFVNMGLIRVVVGDFASAVSVHGINYHLKIWFFSYDGRQGRESLKY